MLTLSSQDSELRNTALSRQHCTVLQSRKNIGAEGPQHMDSIGLDEQEYRRTSSSEASSSSQGYNLDEVLSGLPVHILLISYPCTHIRVLLVKAKEGTGKLDGHHAPMMWQVEGKDSLGRRCYGDTDSLAAYVDVESTCRV